MKRVAVITSSDKGYRGEREDLSGPAVKEIMEAAGYEVVSMDVLPKTCPSGFSASASKITDFNSSSEPPPRITPRRSRPATYCRQVFKKP